MIEKINQNVLDSLQLDRILHLSENERKISVDPTFNIYKSDYFIIKIQNTLPYNFVRVCEQERIQK